MIEDEPASTDLRSRRKFGSQIKMVTASKSQSCHGKYKAAIDLAPFWRLSLTVNDEPENLLILPPLEESIEDKIILFKAEKHEMPMPTATLEERVLIWETLKKEVHAFVHFLMNWEIPQELRSERFGIKEYHHPEIRKVIDVLTPESRLLQFLDKSEIWDSGKQLEGTAEELQTLVYELDPAVANELFDFSTAAGTFLGRLAKRHPRRVQRRGTGKGNRWIISPP